MGGLLNSSDKRRVYASREGWYQLCSASIKSLTLKRLAQWYLVTGLNDLPVLLRSLAEGPELGPQSRESFQIAFAQPLVRVEHAHAGEVALEGQQGGVGLSGTCGSDDTRVRVERCARVRHEWQSGAIR